MRTDGQTRSPGGAVDAALDRIYAANYDHIYRLCFAFLHNHDDAAEAAQEVFARALPLSHRLEDPRGWLYRVARNHCRDQLRQRRVRGAVHLRSGLGTLSGEDPERRALARQAIRAAFASLTDREREALGRVLLLDRSLQTVADDLGVSYASAAQIVSRARRRAAMAASAVVAIGALLGARLQMLRERMAPPVLAVAAAVLCTSTAVRQADAPPAGRAAHSDAGVAVMQAPPPQHGVAPTTPVVAAGAAHTQVQAGQAQHVEPAPVAPRAAPADAAAPQAAAPPAAGGGDCNGAQATVGVGPGGGGATVAACAGP